MDAFKISLEVKHKIIKNKFKLFSHTHMLPERELNFEYFYQKDKLLHPRRNRIDVSSL